MKGIKRIEKFAGLVRSRDIYEVQSTGLVCPTYNAVVRGLKSVESI